MAAYAGIFMLIISLVAIGYHAPQASGDVASVSTVPTPIVNSTYDKPSVDQLVATNLAASVAETANLPVAANVANLSVSLAAKSQLAQSSDTLISKPQIVQPTSGSRTVTTYTTKVGDTAQSIARQFGVSAQTIKWANNMSTDAMAVGKQVVIPPVDGVVYTMKAGDSVEAIAKKYQIDTQRIISFNDLELVGATTGQQLVLPGATLPTTEQPGYAAPRSSGYKSGYSELSMQFAGANAGNKYAFGNCTYWVYDRRVQLGRPVGSFWGNAATWAMYARAAGYRVDRTPEVGAVAQWNAYAGSWIGYAGHVGVVESVNADGSITISEMNNYSLGGFNIVNNRTLSPSEVSNFIH